MSQNEKRNLLEWMDKDGDKPVALRAHAGWFSLGYLFTRDVARIRDVCSKVFMPENGWQSADFPEGIEGLTIWTEDSVIQVYENHESGTSIRQARRNPPDEPEREWEAA